MTPARPALGLWDTISIIVGIVIGAGIYETAPHVFSNVSGPWQALGVWLLGGVLSMMGALCYAELASTYPRSGGDYVYLSRAFGPWLGFLFGWAQLAILITGAIGMMAYVAADYAVVLFGVAPEASFPIALGAVFGVTGLNAIGTTAGRRVQNFLSALKVLGLLGVFVAGCVAAGSTPNAEISIKLNAAGTDAAVPAAGSLGLALIFVLYTFGGWNDAAFVTADVENPRRNVPRALLVGTCAVTLIYLAINAAYLAALGFEGARASRAIAADVVAMAFGEPGRRLVSALVVVSALAAVNGLTLTGSRVTASLGADYPLFARLARSSSRDGAPVVSIFAHGLVAVLLVCLVGSAWARGLIDALLLGLGLPAGNWNGRGGFDALFSCTAPVFWGFFLLTGLGLFVLRRRDRDVERPFRVPFYPVTPLAFCATSLYMLHASLDYAGTLSLVGLLPVLIGLPFYFVSRRSIQRP